jgi:hypothetical protein
MGDNDKFSVLACLEGKTGRDSLLDEVRQDVLATSVLGAMKSYIDQLKGKLDNNARPFQKLAHLFMAGITPARIEGHHDGEAIGLRTGDEHGLFAAYGNFLGWTWGTAIGPVAPWVGKSFTPADPNLLRQYTGDSDRNAAGTYLGINHFRRIEDSVLNEFGFPVLTFWMHLKDAPTQEQDRYGYQKNGGLFVARQASSVYGGSPRDVFQLNYRWHGLGNLPPISYLIDELVELTSGLYLGQLLFATRHVVSQYDPAKPAQEYDYQHFGYFLLMDDSWAEETRRVFKNIGPLPIGSAPSGAAETGSSPAEVRGSARSKFNTFTFVQPPDGNCDDSLLAEILGEMQNCPTILDLLKSYSDELMHHFDNRSRSFLKLRELFNRGTAPDEVVGFFHGAVVSFHAEGLYKVLNLNTLNLGWLFGRMFTPWTGKSFEPVGPDRLKQFTDGFEQGQVPTFWGANTLSFKTARKKFTRQVMKLAGVWTEPVPAEESARFGYEEKAFFFIAHKGTSVNPENESKKVFFFNYRWPKLKTPLPDCYCIDELVSIADGLYMGQLLYATELLKPYDPRQDPAAYKYGLFGYFLLMDDDWQTRRLSIGLDPYEV